MKSSRMVSSYSCQLRIANSAWRLYLLLVMRFPQIYPCISHKRRAEI